MRCDVDDSFTQTHTGRSDFVSVAERGRSNLLVGKQNKTHKDLAAYSGGAIPTREEQFF